MVKNLAKNQYHTKSSNFVLFQIDFVLLSDNKAFLIARLG